MKPRFAADTCVGVLLDLGGPKIRIEGFREGKVLLREGQAIRRWIRRSTPRPATRRRSASPTRTCPRTSSTGTRCCCATGRSCSTWTGWAARASRHGCASAASSPTARDSTGRAAESPRRPSPTGTGTTSASSPRRESITWPSHSRAMRPTSSRRARWCARPAARRASLQRSSDTRR